MMQGRGVDAAMVCGGVVATLVVQHLWERWNGCARSMSYHKDEREGREVKHRYRRRHVKSMESSVPILATEQVDEYRAAVARVVKSEDRCLEVGCHNGTTAFIIAQFARSVVGKVYVNWASCKTARCDHIWRL